MPTTILHVEDDPDLAEVVKCAFEGFGFEGTVLAAETVAEAEAMLDDVSRRGAPIDLIISDMTLPDGSGLDVVHRVRQHPSWEKTPILILSADADPNKVGRAYALGANAYVSKSPRGRPIGAVIKTLYDHWFKDAMLPEDPAASAASLFLTRAIALRSRHAALYILLAEEFGNSPSDVSFWLTRALAESNLANILTFLRGQLAGRELAPDILEDAESAQTEAEVTLSRIEREVDQATHITRDDAYRWMIELVSRVKMRSYLRTISYLFPIAPVAMDALRDFLARDVDELAGWIDVHAKDPKIRRESTVLRAVAAQLRALPPVAQPGVGS